MEDRDGRAQLTPAAGPADLVSGRRLALETAAAFTVLMGFILALSPTGPFSKELGVCESGAVRDVLAGTIVLPHFAPGVPVHTPPLYWWSAALAVRLLGWNEIALRAPSILAGALTGAILYAWVASALGRRAAVWTLVALASCHFFADAVRQPRMDALLMMFIAAAMVCLERATAIARGRGLALLGAGLAMGGATLAKGPIGIILPGLALGIFLAGRRRFAGLLRMDLIAAFAGAAAIGAIWYAAAFHAGGYRFFGHQVERGLYGRFMGSASSVGWCQYPFYYFFPFLFSGFLPWSAYYPALGAVLWRGRNNLPGPAAFAGCWFAAIFGFFSISAGKCLVYILPLFPAVAALTGWMLANAAEPDYLPDFGRRLFGWASQLIGVAALAVIVLLGAMLLAGPPQTLLAHLHRSDRRFLEVLLSSYAAPEVILWAVLWLLGAAAAIAASARGRVAAQSATIALIALSGTLFWSHFLNPALAGRQTLKPFATVVDRTVPAGVPIDYIGVVPDCDLAFYSAHAFASVSALRCGQAATDAYFIVWQDRLTALAPESGNCLEPLAQSSPVDSHGRRLLMLEKSK